MEILAVDRALAYNWSASLLKLLSQIIYVRDRDSAEKYGNAYVGATEDC